MAFTQIGNFSVEHASSLVIYENLMPMIQHINGKGVIDTYTKEDDVRRVNKIDVLRVLPYVPQFRKLGSVNNGAYGNSLNGSGANAPESVYYTVDVDLFFDRSVPIPASMTLSNPTDFKTVVMKNIVESISLGINAITYAKQLIGFFRLKDNFAKSYTGVLADLAGTDLTDAELADAIYEYDGSTVKATDAYLSANGALNDGIPEIGALVVPVSERQAFVSTKLNQLMKAQYEQNASEASARILANGFINPFTDSEGKRIDERTGLCGMYDGVDLYLWNSIARKFTYVALGISSNSTVKGYLDLLQGFIVYGAGTLRGIVRPTVEANKDPYNAGTIILAPLCKVGCECLHGATIKCIVDGSTATAQAPKVWSKSVVAAIMKALSFTPIDGVTVTGAGIVGGFNSGLTA